MFGRKNIIVHDGTDKKTLNGIISIVRMIAGEKSVKDLHKLDDNHPTTMVVEVKANRSRFGTIEDVLSEAFPALCSFNVRV